MERRLDRRGDELRGLRIDDDVPAEQHAADDLPGVRADGGGAGTGGIAGRGHTRDCRRNGLGPVIGHTEFATPIITITRAAPARSGLRW